MPGLPARATAVSATQSPTEFPIASTVKPKIPAADQPQQYNNLDGSKS